MKKFISLCIAIMVFAGMQAFDEKVVLPENSSLEAKIAALTKDQTDTIGMAAITGTRLAISTVTANTIALSISAAFNDENLI
jgi:hypothetical protein